MALKSFNPTTPSQRQLVIVDRASLYKGKPVKALTQGLSSKGGRNNQGRITVRFQGGGHKRTYRLVDFKRRKFDVEGTVERLEYDPNRTAFIALVTYTDGEQAYILAPQRLAAGDKVIASDKAVDVKPGNTMPLQYIPVGSIIHNVEMKPGKGGQIARPPVRMSSSSAAMPVWPSCVSTRANSVWCMARGLASIGAVSNSDHGNINDGKAGRSRWRGKRPHVRGVVMNPVDHPHGGGEGRTSGGRHPVTPWASPRRASAPVRTSRPTSSSCARAISVSRGSH